MTRLIYPLSFLTMLAAPAFADSPAPRSASAPPGEALVFEPAPVQPAPAPPPVVGMTLERLVANPAWQSPVIAVAKTQFAEMPGNCAAAHYEPTSQLMIFQPASFGADGKPFAGAWTEPVAVTGCGAPRTLNVLTIAHADGPPGLIALMPGSSHADPVTQKAALQYAQAVASRSPPPECRRQAFTEARFVKYDGPPNPEVKDGRDARPWQENWMVFACGSTYAINIHFTPNAGGTQLSATNPVKEH